MATVYSPPSVSSIHSNFLNNTYHTTAIISNASLPKYFNVPFALHHGYFRCIRYLLQLRYDPNERDSQLRTPLILCAYVENDRWSLSLAQNLLEKGGRVALEDHARRNALHHACALQRLPLVKLYLSCLDFNIDAQDCEGNTCLHYAALTGHCETAELLMKAAEKVGIRLDQFVNKEGCSAAVLALKYGHIDCANQITHRDCDEFLVVPRPLSIYEILPMNMDFQTTKTKKNPLKAEHTLASRRSNAISFGLLKIIFNESDNKFSTRLAGLCRKDHQQRLKEISSYPSIDTTKSTVMSETICSSTEALVNEIQHGSSSTRTNKTYSQQAHPSFIHSTTSKIQLSVDNFQNIPSNLNKSSDPEDERSKISGSVNYRQVSTSTFNGSESIVLKKHMKYAKDQQMLINKVLQMKAKSAALTNVKYDTSNAVRLMSSVAPKSHQNQGAPELSIQSKHDETKRSKSVLGKTTSNSSRHRDEPLSIQESKHSASRYNQPELLFGLRPEQLFSDENHQPKILEPHSSTQQNDSQQRKHSTNPRKVHLWQDDFNQLIGLYGIHHSSNYRKAAANPHQSTSVFRVVHQEPQHEPPKNRRVSVTKSSITNNLKGLSSSKQSALASLHLPQRHLIQRSALKLSNS